MVGAAQTDQPSFGALRQSKPSCRDRSHSENFSLLDLPDILASRLQRLGVLDLHDPMDRVDFKWLLAKRSGQPRQQVFIVIDQQNGVGHCQGLEVRDWELVN
jgi:hypothetical protein